MPIFGQEQERTLNDNQTEYQSTKSPETNQKVLQDSGAFLFSLQAALSISENIFFAIIPGSPQS